MSSMARAEGSVNQDAGRLDNLTQKGFADRRILWHDETKYSENARSGGINTKGLSGSSQPTEALLPVGMTTGCIFIAFLVIRGGLVCWNRERSRSRASMEASIKSSSLDLKKLRVDGSGANMGGLSFGLVWRWLLHLFVGVSRDAWKEPSEDARLQAGSNGIGLNRLSGRLHHKADHLYVGGKDDACVDVREEHRGEERGDRGPHHVAIIMDGNRRYGQAMYGDPLKGHSDGGKALGHFLEWCSEEGIKMVTAYAFSTENWKRDPEEVSMLMELLCKACKDLMNDAVKNNMRIRVLVCDTSKLPGHVLTALHDAEESTKSCDGFQFNICLSYGGRQEIALACQQIASRVSSGTLSVDAIDEALVGRHLLTSGFPDPDILIRTSGERRVSNFLLFQLAYTELFFVNKFWPEMTREDLVGVLEDYKTRHRRYGC